MRTECITVEAISARMQALSKRQQFLEDKICSFSDFMDIQASGGEFDFGAVGDMAATEF